MVPRLSGTVGATTLTVDQLAAHTHIAEQVANQGFYMVGNYGKTTGQVSQETSSTGNSASHTHSLAGSTTSITSIPLFYALSFIIRCA